MQTLAPFDLVAAVNAQVNVRNHYVPDLAHYNAPEFWAAIDQEGGGAGDCEDYALAKRSALLAAGVDHSSLRLATCTVETGEGHAVLVVTTDQGQFVLDNRYPDPMPRQALPYIWTAIQEGKTWHAL